MNAICHPQFNSVLHSQWCATITSASGFSTLKGNPSPPPHCPASPTALPLVHPGPTPSAGSSQPAFCLQALASTCFWLLLSAALHAGPCSWSQPPLHLHCQRSPTHLGSISAQQALAQAVLDPQCPQLSPDEPSSPAAGLPGTKRVPVTGQESLNPYLPAQPH